MVKGVNYMFKVICELLTKHKFRKLYAYNETKTEFYYKCKLCGYRFWNNKGE